MAISVQHIVTQATTADQTSYSLGDVEVRANNLTLVWVYTIASTLPNVPTLAGVEVEWTQMTTTVDKDSLRRLTVFRALPSITVTEEVVVDFGGQTQASLVYSISRYDGVNTSGTNGSGAIGNLVDARSATNTSSLSISMPQIQYGGNVLVSGFGIPRNDPGIPSPGPGYTLLGQSNTSGPNISMMTEYKVAESTNPTVVDAYWNGLSLPSVGVAIELVQYTPEVDADWSAIGKEDGKTYLYKVYKPNGEFVGTWTDVTDDPQFTQKLNTPGTTMTVQLSRSPNTTKEKRDVMTTEDGEVITTEDGHNLMVSYETNNSVGEGTDVDINYNVDVYVIYGGFDTLVTQDGEPITTEDGEELLVSYGAPNGVRIFSGFILDYESAYDETTGVTVTLASHGYKLSHELVRSGEVVKVDYSNQYVHTILKSILDTNPGSMTYSAESISSANTDSITAKFVLNTKLEAIDSLHDQSPSGWYWYGNVADNYIYLQPPATQPHHKFLKGYHIKGLRLKRSIENLRNRVYFVGAEVSGVNILKKYEDTPSQEAWGLGLHRITDRRFSISSSMQRYANKEMSRYSQPIWTTELTISSAKYDLESVKLGQVVGFGNFGNFVDGLTMQIVGITYTPTRLTLELGELLPAQANIVADIEEDLQNEQYEKIPNQPS